MTVRIAIEKDYWDIVAVIFQVITPIFIAIGGTYIAYLLTRRNKEEANRIAAVHVLGAILPHLAHKDKIVREVAMTTVLHLGRDEWNVEVAHILRILVANGSSVNLQTGEVATPLYEWIVKHLVPIINASGQFECGVRSGSWLITIGSERVGSVGFFEDGPMVLDSQNYFRSTDLGICVYRMPTWTPKLTQTEKASEVSSLSLAYPTRSGSAFDLNTVYVDFVEDDGSYFSIIETKDGIFTGTLGAVILKSLSTNIFGIVVANKSKSTLKILHWEAISSFIASLDSK